MKLKNTCISVRSPSSQAGPRPFRLGATLTQGFRNRTTNFEQKRNWRTTQWTVRNKWQDWGVSHGKRTDAVWWQNDICGSTTHQVKPMKWVPNTQHSKRRRHEQCFIDDTVLSTTMHLGIDLIAYTLLDFEGQLNFLHSIVWLLSPSLRYNYSDSFSVFPPPPSPFTSLHEVRLTKKPYCFTDSRNRASRWMVSGGHRQS